MGRNTSEAAARDEVLYSGAAFCLLVPVLNVRELPAAPVQIQTPPALPGSPESRCR